MRTSPLILNGIARGLISPRQQAKSRLLRHSTLPSSFASTQFFSTPAVSPATTTKTIATTTTQRRNGMAYVPTKQNQNILPANAIRSAQVSPSATRVHVSFNDGHECEFDMSWLSANCQCSTCRTSSGQRSGVWSMAHAVSRRQASHVVCQTDSNSMRVSWSDTIPNQCSLERDGAHVVEFDGEWLRQHSYDDVTLETEQGLRRAMNDSVLSELPHVSYESVTGSEEGLCGWLRNLNKFGACVIDDAPKRNGVVKGVGELVGPLSHTIYGDTFEVKTDPNPINVAYTDLMLPPHMDLAYFESPPGLQMLHCIQFDKAVKGGESTFIDSHAVAEEFQIRNPDSFQNLVRIPATFQKDHVDRANPVKMFYQRPHIQTNHYGQVVSVFWAPPFEGPLRVSSKDVDAYYSAYAAFEDLLMSDEMWAKYGREFRMREGQIVTFNNRRLLHGRKAFTSQDGVRHLEGCYLDIDMFLCKHRVLSDKLKDGPKGQRAAIGAVNERRAGAGTWF